MVTPPHPSDPVTRRLAPVLFGLLVLATVAAFYLTQHLKSQNPLINGGPRADPPVINPTLAGVCRNEAGRLVSFRRTRVGFYLQARSDNVSVYVVNAGGTRVATMAGSGRYLRRNNGSHYSFFTWNGRTAAGTPVPAGTYGFDVLLLHEDRFLPLNGVTVQVSTARPRPAVSGLSVAPASSSVAPSSTVTVPAPASTRTSTTAAAATRSAVGPDPVTVLVPGAQRLTVRFAPRHLRAARVLVYRVSASTTHPLTLVKSFGVDPRGGQGTWDGLIHGRPAPAGSYLIGLRVLDASCTAGQVPAVSDPLPAMTAQAGVEVTALTASTSTLPTPAGQRATVHVFSGGLPYTWRLFRAGSPRVLGHGHAAGAARLRVRLPAVGLYVLAIAGAGGHRTAVPLVASGVRARASTPVLVVLPALSWQGHNATGQHSDGLIDTLSAGGQIALRRPYIGGLPADLADEADLLRFLDRAGDAYDLTTDTALSAGIGPTLAGRHGVLLDGDFTWLPANLVGSLGRFVAAGGGAFAFGQHVLQSVAPVDPGPGTAGPARPLAVDPFGVRHGAVSPSGGQIITALTDGLGLFRNVPALVTPSYQVLQPPGGKVASAAGVAPVAPSIVGFRSGRGTVVEAGLPRFGASLGTDVDAAQMLRRIWQVVLR
ncbi:MAG TPA: N,N-dimethylformamidase beta subunit family domain-containing protein [Solirubrobacteraceae bacterium]|nr:N,N-dimethylformamidase beta subunit family domain-containing protein [Solirubrobacteraceae bacterium]